MHALLLVYKFIFLLIDNVFWLIFIFALEIYDANNNRFHNKLNVLVYDGSVSSLIRTKWSVALD